MDPVDALTEQAIAAVRHALGEDQDERATVGCPLCILVDPCLHDPLSLQEPTQALARLTVPVRGIEPRRRPYLLTLPDTLAHERAVNASLRTAVQEHLGLHDAEQGSPRSVCAWLRLRGGTAPPVPLSLADLLARHANVRPPPGHPSGPTVFRYWDPRITVDLPACLGQEWAWAMEAMGVQDWWLLGAQGRLHRAGPVLEPGRAACGDPPGRFQLDGRQWIALQAASWGRRVAQLLPAWALPRVPEARAIDDAVRRALGYGLHEDADILAFVRCACALHPLFDRHARVAAVLAALPSQGLKRRGFAVQAAQWDDGFLHLLQQGHWLGHTAPERPVP